MKYIITAEQLQTILNYLGSKPYVEVAKLVLTLGQLEPHDTSKKNDTKLNK